MPPGGIRSGRDTMRSPASWLLLAAGVLVAPPSLAATAIPRHVVASGGGRVQAAGHAVTGTVGQPVAAAGSAVHHTLTSGFWPGAPGGQVGVGDETVPAPPAFRLHPNRPNPFGPRTAIRFDVPAGGGRVTLRVYDFRGRLVRTLIDGMQTPGVHLATWDGRDDRGAEAASGTYILLMESPEGRHARKATRIR